jgi:hypothetical protein
MDVVIASVVIDCADPLALAPFWREVLAYEVVEANQGWVLLDDPDGVGVSVGLQKVPEAKAGKNRVHMDLSAEDEEVSALRAQSMGATRLWVSDDPDDPFVVLADPEGNEFCVVRE